MNTQQRKDLLSLATLLDRLPIENFDMEQFQDEVTDSHADGHDHNPDQEISCGTACCVAGWAAILDREWWDGKMIDEADFSERYGITPWQSYGICIENQHWTASQKAAEIRQLIAEYSSKTD